MALAGSRSGVLKLFNYVNYQARPIFRNLCMTYRIDKRYLLPRLCIFEYRKYTSQENPDKSPDVNPKKKKKIFIPRITLLTESNEMSIVTMEMAEKIANRRNLKLVKIVDFDTKTERPTYKLMTTKDFIEEGMARKKVKKMEKDTSIKPEKMMTLSSKISEHDLETKLKNIKKFLIKRHEVRAVITIDGNEEKTNEIYTQLETVLNNLSVRIQKSQSHGKLKIHMIPNVESNISDDSEIDSKDNKNEQ